MATHYDYYVTLLFETQVFYQFTCGVYEMHMFSMHSKMKYTTAY
jgi:hypothetical protein